MAESPVGAPEPTVYQALTASGRSATSAALRGGLALAKIRVDQRFFIFSLDNGLAVCSYYLGLENSKRDLRAARPGKNSGFLPNSSKETRHVSSADPGPFVRLWRALVGPTPFARINPAPIRDS